MWEQHKQGVAGLCAAKALGGRMEDVICRRARHGGTEDMAQVALCHLRQCMHHTFLYPPESAVLLYMRGRSVTARVMCEHGLVFLSMADPEDEPYSNGDINA